MAMTEIDHTPEPAPYPAAREWLDGVRVAADRIEPLRRELVGLMDARDDLEKDQKKGSYNILLPLRQKDPEGFEDMTQTLLIDMMSSCCRSFERLPIVEHSAIIRNVLYSGVWNKYREQLKEREGSKGKETT